MGFLDRLRASQIEDLPADWKVLGEARQIEEIKKASHQKPIVIFKHSTSCGISSMAKYKLEDKWDFSGEDLEFYYLDLLSNRPISNAVADAFGVVHQSPQILVIKNGKAIFNTSHHMVSIGAIKEAIA